MLSWGILSFLAVSSHAAGDEGLKMLHRIDMEDKPIQASIAISDGHLFIRTTSKLFCVGD